MTDENIYEVRAQEDFVERLTAARSTQALSECIWNAVDAEATRVTVTADHDGFGRLAAVRITDNGHGIPPEEAESLFTYLGGSWKRSEKRSRNGKRILHGEEGKGRFRALALGRVAEWHITSRNRAGEMVQYRITIIKDNARNVRITEPVPAPAGSVSGVEVCIREPYKDWEIEVEGVRQELCETYALYLTEYSDVEILIAGMQLDPATVMEHRARFPLPDILDGQDKYPVELEVIEWKTETERMLYLCSERGFPLHRITPGIQAPGFDFSAYLSSLYISKLHERGVLGLTELDKNLHSAVEDAKTQLRDHFKQRAAAESRNLVDQWKSEKVYPFGGEPTGPVQIVERQVFDIVALNVATSLPDFQSQDTRNRRFQLRMLRQAIERSPEELQLIMSELLGLSKRKQEELAKLLKRTSLGAIISAAKMVTERLDFLKALESMLFDLELKPHFKERSQLHRILAKNTWVFGEEFALSVNDRSLTEVLRQHFQKQGREILVDTPVKRLDGTKGIVDLMLSRRVPSAREDEHEHLIVELKAPAVRIGVKETSQIKSYAFAIKNDERFQGVPTRWTLWLLANDLDDYAKNETKQANLPEGVLWQGENPPMRIWVKRWSQVLNDCRTRLSVFQKELDYIADREDSLEYLKKTYARILEGAPEPEPSKEEEAEEAFEVDSLAQDDL